MPLDGGISIYPDQPEVILVNFRKAKNLFGKKKRPGRFWGREYEAASFIAPKGLKHRDEPLISSPQ